MKRRCHSHDYRKTGIYLITLEVRDRAPLLGRLSIDGWPRIDLSVLGRKIKEEELPKISRFYPFIEVWKDCIMPDHIHLILRVAHDFPTGKNLGNVIMGFKSGCTALYRSMTPGESRSLFEKGYNDRFLKHEGHLEVWKRYLTDNPRRLAIKRTNPDLFRVIYNMEIAGQKCQMAGNGFLLDNPDKMAVIVHRRDSREEFESKKHEWMNCGERGGVLVGAWISKWEKEMLAEALLHGYSIIRLRENGFPPLYKPSGEAFNACSEGRLLDVSLWEYNSEARPLTRDACLKMNALAETIAQTSAFHL